MSIFIDPKASADYAIAAASANANAAAVPSAPDGSVTKQSMFGQLRDFAVKTTRAAATSLSTIFKPSNIAIPGSAATVSSVNKVADAGASAVKSGAQAVAAAGVGITSGFRIGAIIVVVLAFLFLRHHLK